MYTLTCLDEDEPQNHENIFNLVFYPNERKIYLAKHRTKKMTYRTTDFLTLNLN